MFDEKSHACVYNTGDVLAITIAPNDSVQHYRNAKRYQQFLTYYSQKLNRLFETKYFSYWFRVEASEPIGQVQTEGPRLHLHGLLHMKKNLSVFLWLTDIMPDILQHARMEIRHIKDESCGKGWIEYCMKQKKYMPSQNAMSSIDPEILLKEAFSPRGENIMQHSVEKATPSEKGVTGDVNPVGGQSDEIGMPLISHLFNE